jgi:radical SAM superfamily enzyme YgiQ (UPF0313 family)
MLIFPNFESFELISHIPHQPSLSLAYLAAILARERIEFQVIDAPAEKLKMDQVLNRIKQYNPNCVGITTNISLSYSACYYSLVIKKKFPNIIRIFGGPWASVEYSFILEKKYADIVVIGEGEYTLSELSHIDMKNIDSLKKIKGIAFKEANHIYFTGNRPYIENLNELPHPLWDCFPRKSYSRAHRENPFYPFITSRGCIYNCMNCTKVVHGYKMRYRSIENMLTELDYLKKIGAKEIAIEDDLVNFDMGRIKLLFREIIKRKYNFRFQFRNGIRADKIDLELAHLLYTAGTYRVALGIESGSQKVVDFLGKKLNLSILKKNISILHTAHLKVSGYFIMGLPIENLQSMLHTINFADRINLDTYVYMNLIVFPGTKLYDYVVNHTNYLGDHSKLKKNPNYQYSPLEFTTKSLNSKVMNKVKIYYLIRAFLNPKNFFRFLSCFTFKEIMAQNLVNLKILIRKLKS